MFWVCPEVMFLEPVDVLIEDCLGKQKERERDCLCELSSLYVESYTFVGGRGGALTRAQCSGSIGIC